MSNNSRGVFSLDALIQDSLDISYSIHKFLKYCDHLAMELDSGFDFTREGFRGNGHALIIIPHLGLEESQNITLDTMIEILFHLLKTDYFDDNLPLFSHTYGLFRKLIRYCDGDINYLNHIKILHRKGTELYSGNSKYLLAPPIHQFQGEIQKKMRECLNIFIDLCDFLKILASNTSHIYIGDARYQTIHPQYTHFKDSFYTLVDEYEFWELSKYDEAVERGRYNAERCNDNDLIDWYNEVEKLPLEEAVLQFSIFLLKSGEFDILINRDDIKIYLLQIAKKIGEERVAEIDGYKFRDNSEYIDTDLTNKTEEIIDILMRARQDSITDHAVIIDEYLHLLRSKHIITPKEHLSALQSDDIEDTLHSIIRCDILGKNKISHPTVKKKCIDFCEQYNQRIRQETREKIDSILGEDEDDLSEDDGVDEFPEDEFIDLLYKGITILENLQEIGYELYSYDVFELIKLAQEEGIIGDDIADELSRLDDSEYVIYQVFMAVMENNYLEEIGREDLLEEYKDHLYALNMLFIN